MVSGQLGSRTVRRYLRFVACSLVFAVAAWSTVLRPATLRARQSVPGFAVVTSSGTWHVYSSATVNDAVLTATISDEGGGRWKLNITQARQALQTVYFPWQPQRTPLDNDISNDIYYYPFLMGRTEKAANRNGDWTWWGLVYPGLSAAPLVVMADPNSAKIVAATNWPPKTVTPLYAAQRLVLRYDNAVAVGGSATFSALVATVTGNAATGDVPWHTALDLYRNWLDTALGPITYPAWMWEGHGMLDIQLESSSYTNTAAVNTTWQLYKARYPWLLMWGQNSPLGGSCCGIDPGTSRYYPWLPTMDGRFVSSGLPAWARSVVLQGAHVGYYSAPFDEQYGSGQPRGNLDTPEGLAWFTNWNNANRSYGANSYYFDTLARTHWGNPAYILDLFRTGALSTDAMAEGIVDISPLPGLISGSLQGGGLCGAPFKTPENQTITSFPPFVRYLLNDRLVYWGWENGDLVFWGTASPSGCDYSTWCANGRCHNGTERALFLSGARISFSHGRGNAILDAIVSERERVNWWARAPRYLATKGLNLTTIPASSRVEVAHFQDRNRASLVAISNPNLVAGLSFTINGAVVAVPVQKISIVEAATGIPGAPTNLRIVPGSPQSGS